MVRYLLLVCLVLSMQLVCKICAEADGLNSNSVTESQAVVMNTVIAQDPSITSNPNQVTIRAIPDNMSTNTTTAKPMHTIESIQISSISTKADDATIALNNSNDKTTFQSTETNPTNGVIIIQREGNSLYCKIFNILLSGEYCDAPITYTLLEQSELLLKRSLLCTMNGMLTNQLFH